MKKYKAFFIDNDGTIMDFAACSKAALYLTLDKPDNINELFDMYLQENNRLWGELERGQITRARLRKERFVKFFDQAGIEQDPVQASETYVRELSRQAVLVDGAKEALNAMSGRIKLFMTTNGIALIQRGRLAISGIEKYFDGVFISDEMNAKKPDLEFFDCAVKLSGCAKSEILVVGDSPSADIAGGKNAGLDTCLVGKARADCTPTYVIQDLRELTKFIT